MRAQRLKEHRLPGYVPVRNRHNDYGFDPQEQATLTWSGMGLDINVHDQWAVEGMGAIQDRTREHLVGSDVGIVRYRRMLRAAIRSLAANGDADLPMGRGVDLARIVGPVCTDVIAPTGAWQHAGMQADRDRRAACPWTASV